MEKLVSSFLGVLQRESFRMQLQVWGTRGRGARCIPPCHCLAWSPSALGGQCAAAPPEELLLLKPCSRAGTSVTVPSTDISDEKLQSLTTDKNTSVLLGSHPAETKSHLKTSHLRIQTSQQNVLLQLSPASPSATAHSLPFS